MQDKEGVYDQPYDHPSGSSVSSASHDQRQPFFQSDSESSFLAGLDGIGSSTPLPASSGGGGRSHRGGPDTSETSSDFIMESPVERFSRLIQADIEKDRSLSSSVGSALGREDHQQQQQQQQRASVRSQQQISRDDHEYDSDQDSPDVSFADAYDEPGSIAAEDADIATPRAGAAATAAGAYDLPPDLASLTVSSSGLPNFPQSRASQPPEQKQPKGKGKERPIPTSMSHFGGQQQQAPRTTNNPATPNAANRSSASKAKWTGLTDLRSTPLTVSKTTGARSYGYAKEDDSDSDSSLDDLLPPGMSPPVTINFALPPSSRGLQSGQGRFVPTPLKEAVPRVVDGLLGRQPQQQGSSALSLPTPTRPIANKDVSPSGSPGRRPIGRGGSGSSSSSGSDSDEDHSFERAPPPASSTAGGGLSFAEQLQASASSVHSYGSRSQALDVRDASFGSSNSSSSSSSSNEADLSLGDLPAPPPPPTMQQHQHHLPQHQQPPLLTGSYLDQFRVPVLPPLPPPPPPPPQASQLVGVDESFDSDDSRFLEDEAAYGSGNLINFDNESTDDPFGAGGGSRGLQQRFGGGGQGRGFLLGTTDEMLTFNG